MWSYLVVTYFNRYIANYWDPTLHWIYFENMWASIEIWWHTGSGLIYHNNQVSIYGKFLLGQIEQKYKPWLMSKNNKVVHITLIWRTNTFKISMKFISIVLFTSRATLHIPATLANSNSSAYSLLPCQARVTSMYLKALLKSMLTLSKFIASFSTSTPKAS